MVLFILRSWWVWIPEYTYFWSFTTTMFDIVATCGEEFDLNWTIMVFQSWSKKKIDKWLTIAVNNFWLRFHYTCMHTYLISISPFKLCYLALSAGCGLFWQRESLVLSDSCQWYIQSVCVFRQVLLLWRWVSGLVHYSTGEVGMTVYIIDKFIPHITDLLTYKMLHDRLGTKDSVLMSHFLR